MAEQKTFYVTTPIYYPSGNMHIGHTYTTVAADTITRFKKLTGYNTFFLTGTDEHGQKIERSAQKAGLAPKEYIDGIVNETKALWKLMNVEYDDFIRTTDERHMKAVQKIFRQLYEQGDIYKGSYEGQYCAQCEAFWTSSQILEGNLCPDCGRPTELVHEESYFFRLSAYEERLLKLYEENPDFIGPAERRNEILSFVKSGLKDLSISRTTFDWGIPVPGDEKHVMYVWVDALTNYMTGVGYPDENADLWPFWPADLHVIGKDITRFHTVYWPAFLMSAGIALPKRVFGHGFVFNRGEKMSKSVGNVIDPFALVEHYGLDQVRYFLLREVPFGQDGNYSHEAIVNRTNADLANDLGNLAQRSLSMIAKNCGGVVPQKGELQADDLAILAQAQDALVTARAAMNTQAIHTGLAAIFSVVAEANRYFAGQEPWALKKTDPARMETVLWTTAETVRRVAILCQPYMPESSSRLLDLLSVSAETRSFANVADEYSLTPGDALRAPQGVFPRYVETEAAN